MFVNSTSTNFLHEFSGHQDTVDCISSTMDHQATFEPEHHHCHFLDFTFSVYHHSISRYDFTELTSFSALSQVKVTFFRSVQAHRTHLRGPPLI